MKAEDIKVGLMFKYTDTDSIFEVVRYNGTSVWVKDLVRTPIWRFTATNWINLFKNNTYELVK